MAAPLLLVPSIMIAIVLEPGVSFSTLLIVSLFAGWRRQFASSMTNINASTRLGSRAGHWESTPAEATSVCLPFSSSACWYWRLSAPSTRAVVAIYIPLIILAAIGAVLKMDNLA